MPKKLYIVDALANIYRAYHALPALTSSKGVPTGAVYGFLKIILKIVDDKPDYLVVVFDSSLPTVRHRVYSGYKSTRPPTPNELKEQIPIIKQFLSAMGINYLEVDKYEADDLIASIVNKLPDDLEVIVVSTDKDILQLVRRNVKVYKPTTDELFTVDMVKKKFGVSPELIPDYLAIVGDKVDNIPGIKGVGPKGAIEILHNAGSLESALEKPESVKNKKLSKKLMDFRNDALFSLTLVRLDDSIPFSFSLEDFKLSEPNYSELKKLLIDYEFFSLIDKFFPDAKNSDKRCEKVDVTEIPNEFGAFYFRKNDSSYQLAFRVSDGRVYIVSLSSAQVKKLLLSPASSFFCYDLKEIVKELKVDLHKIVFDVKILSHLENPDRKDYTLSTLIFEKTAEKVSEQDLVNCACSLWDLGEILCKKLENNRLLDLYKKIEYPLVEVLAFMERNGVALDIDFLRQLSSEVACKIDELESEIYRLAGVKFNINSPKQLGFILFEKMKLPILKKTKKTKSYSTSAEVLLELAELGYQLPKIILEYRELTKLKSTYLDVLVKMIDSEGRLHTTYDQIGTATGRISSSNPNLQNIPIRGEFGSKIRKAFVAPVGKKIIAADYNQIELRILAHLSQDKRLMKAFEEGLDVHRVVASQIFNKSLEEITSEERRIAKTVNFGVIYGLSPYGLSQQLRIPVEVAKSFIEGYFEYYPQVREFIEHLQKQAGEKGYVKTYFGRIRYIPNIHSSNRTLRDAAKRIAVNTPIQGTAADILKLAMIDLFAWIKTTSSDTKMVLTVHDELVFETEEKEADFVARKIKDKMEQVVSLSVPLKVDVGIGNNWLEAKK